MRIYSLQSGALSETKVLDVPGEPFTLAYSPDGSYLSVGADRRVCTFSVPEYQV